MHLARVKQLAAKLATTHSWKAPAPSTGSKQQGLLLQGKEAARKLAEKPLLTVSFTGRGGAAETHFLANMLAVVTPRQRQTHCLIHDGHEP